MRTVNSLPEDYSGKCKVLMNDFNCLVTARNIVILSVLHDLEPELAADVALHASYSAFLTPRLRRELRNIWGWIIDDDEGSAGTGTITFALRGKVYSVLREMYRSDYTAEETRKTMADAIVHPSRIDYRDRYLASLRPGHRLSSMHYWSTNIVAPFAADLSAFIYPNRLVHRAQP